MTSEAKMNLDRILTEEVGVGKFQLRALGLCAVTALLAGLHSQAYLFLFAKVATRCRIPECEFKSSSEVNFTQPWIHNAVPVSGNSMDHCHRFRGTSENYSEQCPADLFDRDSLVKCEEYVYEHKNTAFYEFNLACDDWRPNLIGSVNLFGMMLCLPISGFIADRWGRRISLALTFFNRTWIGCLSAWAGSYDSFVLIAFVQYVTGACVFPCVYILAIEYVQPKYRVMAGASMSTCIALGYCLQSFVASRVLYWRHLVLILEVPSLISISYFWIAPESIRWLISKGRYEEAMIILQKAAKMNGNVLSDKTLKEFSEVESVEKKEKNSEPWLICLVFKHKTILFRCVISPLVWVIALFVHYGLTICSVGVSSNLFLNLGAVAAIEIPGYWTAILLMDRIGRKPLIISAFWICGACMIAYIFVHNGYYWLSFCIYLIGKLEISAVMTSLYVYTAELYPTRHRSSLMAYSSMVGRIGAIIAPLTPAFSATFWEYLPFVLFVGMAFLAGLLVLMLPETLGTTLPDSMEDAARLGQGPSKTLGPLRKFLFRRKCYIIG